MPYFESRYFLVTSRAPFLGKLETLREEGCATEW